MSISLMNEGFYTCDYSQHLIPISCIATFSYGGGVRPQYTTSSLGSLRFIGPKDTSAITVDAII